PSLLLSTAAAIMVTRVSSSEDMGQQVNRQMFASPKALAISAAILIAMGAEADEGNMRHARHGAHGDQ
ncbi:FHIPEP family type III secretion protein, partial [Pseudomonas aeruginosa]|uniref:FHIPEP family type III secretion protein n=1 Tax=Pseudomonas aeruginosa TaxID=287 RepID=UPI0024BC87F9